MVLTEKKLAEYLAPQDATVVFSMLKSMLSVQSELRPTACDLLTAKYPFFDIKGNWKLSCY